jgi:DNA-binding NarL/FixJ family response regulator
MHPKPAIIVLTHRTLLSQLLEVWLKEQKSVSTVLAAEDGSELLAVARRRLGAIYLLDPGDPRRDAFDLARAIRRLDPSGRVVVIAEAAAEGWVRSTLEIRAAAFIGPSAGLDDLERALESVRAGLTYYSPCAAQLIADLVSPAAQRLTLTDREIQVLLLICEGQSSKQIGAALRLSSKTIDRHRARIMAKTGIKSATGLVRYACDQRLVVPRAAVR